MNIERIKNKITINENSCWIWNGSVTSAGYGQLMEDGKYWTTHRYSFTCINGPIEDNLIIRHMCHNTKCCNPEHLSIGSHSDNWNDSIYNHNTADAKRRKIWNINNKEYATIREASKETGLHHKTIIKYIENGVFNIEKYRAGCKRSSATPKI